MRWGELGPVEEVLEHDELRLTVDPRSLIPPVRPHRVDPPQRFLRRRLDRIDGEVRREPLSLGEMERSVACVDGDDFEALHTLTSQRSMLEMGSSVRWDEGQVCVTIVWYSYRHTSTERGLV